MNDRKRKKRDKEKAQNATNIEVKVDLEHYKIYDIENSTILRAEKNRFDPFIFARKNPEFAAFTFTLITSVAYFLIRMIAFLFFTGLCLYYKVDLNYINVNNDSIIFITLITVSLSLFLAFVSDEIQKKAKKKPVLSFGILFVILNILFFLILHFSSLHISILIKIISSTCATVVVILCVLLSYFLSYISALIFRKFNEKIDRELAEMSFSKRLSIAVAIILTMFFVTSFKLGYDLASDKKKYDTIDDTYVVLYMNDEVAVCSPYIKKGNNITIDRSVHKNFSISNIELKTIEFDNVE